MSRDETNVTFNFPIAFIPYLYRHEENWRKILRDACLSFAIVYFTKEDEPTEADVQEAMEKMCIKGDPARNLEKGKPYLDKWRDCQTPLTSLNRNHFWTLVKLPYVSRLELISLCAYLALRSICRRRNAETSTTIDMIFARMEGKSVYDGNVSPDLQMWKTRRHFAGIKRLLSEVYDVQFKAGKTRGIVFKIGNPPPT